MKNRYKIIMLLFSALLVISGFNSCTEEDEYDYNAITPKVLGGIKGPVLGIQTFTANYTIGYHRGGSTWNWSANEATVKSVSEDTRTATIEFTQYPSDGKATVTVTETTMGGITSEPVNLEVTVKKYCPLTNGVAGLVGTWSGTDGQGDYTFPSIISSAVNGTNLSLTGVGVGFINDFWGEAVIAGGTINVTINVDGTLTIPRQYIFTTEYEGEPYDYEIKGSGTWDNCGSSPKLLIDYDIYYAGEATGLAAKYKSYLGGKAYLTADIQLDVAP